MNDPKIIKILETDCVGDSLSTINGNFSSLSSSVVDNYLNPQLASTSVCGAIKVGSGLFVDLNNGKLHALLDGATLEFNNNTISVREAGLSQFVRKSGDSILGSLSIDDGGSQVGISKLGVGISKNELEQKSQRLYINGASYFANEITLPGSTVIDTGVGTGVINQSLNTDVYSTYNTVIKLTESLALKNKDSSSPSILFDSRYGGVYAKQKLHTNTIELTGLSYIKKPDGGNLVIENKNTNINLGENGVGISAYPATGYRLNINGKTLLQDIAYYKTDVGVTDLESDAALVNLGYVKERINNLGGNLSLYVPLSGALMQGELKVPNLSSNNTTVNNLTANLLKSNKIEIDTTNEVAPLTIKTIDNIIKFSINSSGNIYSQGGLSVNNIKVSTGLPLEGNASTKGYSFSGDGDTGVFSNESGHIALFVNGLPCLEAKNITANTSLTANYHIKQSNVPQDNFDLVNKIYTDSKISTSIDAIDFTPYALKVETLPISGGEITHSLSVSSTPSLTAHVVNLDFLNKKLANYSTWLNEPVFNKVTVTTEVSSNFIKVNNEPVDSKDVVNKGYFDNYSVPIGGIILWSGQTIPDGWALCDGTRNTPNLSDKFILATTDLTKIGLEGGSSSYTTDSGGVHNHGAKTNDHTLDITQIPSHSHVVDDMYGSYKSSDNTTYVDLSGSKPVLQRWNDGTDNDTWSSPLSSSDNTVILTATRETHEKGGSLPHNHGIPDSGAHTHSVTNVKPPYYTLAYIMNIGRN